MTYAQDIKDRLYAETPSPVPIRAVIYARVSTDNDSQKDSCANQILLAEKFLDQHPNIQLVRIFCDDGISGKNDYNRPEYSKMVDLLNRGGVDLIITKALSRLNRDQYNALRLTNLLIAHCATVYTIEDNQLHDFEDINSSLLHGLNYAIDAQYVLRQSISGHKTQELRCARKELTAKDISYGYRWDKNAKSISINKEEAAVIVFIFEEYVLRNETPAAIYNKLRDRGIQLCEKSVTNILQDERYIGNFYINKRTSRLGTGNNKTKRIMLPKDQWVLVERPDLRIIDDDLFYIAQKIRKTRKSIYMRNGQVDVQARFQGVHKFASKIFCECCGRPYQFRCGRNNVPMYRINNHSACESSINSISEQDLETITKQALKASVDSQNDICDKLERLLTECVEELQDNTKSIDKLIAQKNKKELQIETLINELSEGGLSEASRNRIRAKINDMEADIEGLAKTISDTESVKHDSTYVREKIQTIKEAFKDLRNFTTLDRDRIINYIDRIIVHKNGDLDLFLRSGRTIYITAEQMQFPSHTDNEDDNDGDPDEDSHHSEVKTRIQAARY